MLLLTHANVGYLMLLSIRIWNESDKNRLGYTRLDKIESDEIRLDYMRLD